MPVQAVAMGLHTALIAAKWAKGVVLPASNGNRVFLSTIAVVQPTGQRPVCAKSIKGKANYGGAEKSIHGGGFRSEPEGARAQASS